MRRGTEAPSRKRDTLGHIFDGILGIKSRIKVMPTLKFVVPDQGTLLYHYTEPRGYLSHPEDSIAILQ